MNTVDLHHVIDGPDDAPAVVLFPSLGSTLELWEPQVAALAEHFRVVRVDPRGHGGSPVPQGPYSIDDIGGDVVALLDRLGIERAHVVGVSLGGMVAMWLAAHAPERVERLALICTSAYLPPATNWIERAETVRAKGTGSIADVAVGRWFTEGFRAREPERVAAAVAMLEATPDEGYAACCEAIAGMDLREDLPRITADTLVIAGADDPATPPSHAEAIVGSVPGARLQIVPDAAHLATLEQPEAIGALVVAHLGGAR